MSALVRFCPLPVLFQVTATSTPEATMKNSMATILAMAVAILAIVPGFALAKLATNHNQTGLRG